MPKPIEAEKAPPPAKPPVERDLPAIAADKALHVLVTFNSTGYFIYRGETMGYEYELLSRFAAESKLKLHVIVVRDSDEMFTRLNAGDGDVVAAQLAATTNVSQVAESHALYETAPVVVQRRGENAPATPALTTAMEREERETSPSPVEIRARLVATPEELAGMRVHVPRTSPYRPRLLELNEALTQDIDVVEVDETSDHLIQRLSEGDIAYTVAAENLAALKAGEYTNLVIKPQIGPPQPVVWAVRRNAPQLLAALDRFIDAKRKSGLLAVLYRKYFLDRRGFQKRAQSPYLATETGALSPYDEWFREYAKIPGWDWRLLAAQAFQESRFNTSARSWAGAVGLMQIMPRTARQLRVNASDPRQSIEGACRYLWSIDDQLKDAVPDESERIKFILGAYNVGLGHVQDAQRLAKKYGDDPRSWSDVGYWLIRKSKRAFYNDPVVRHGFCRGTEPVAYVDEIVARWEKYRDAAPNAEPLD